MRFDVRASQYSTGDRRASWKKKRHARRNAHDTSFGVGVAADRDGRMSVGVAIEASPESGRS